MIVGEIKDELTKMLGNELSSAGHPFVTPVDYRYRWITRAANNVARYAAASDGDIEQIFGELHAEWQAQTQDSFAYIARPDNALIIRELWSFDKTGANADIDGVRFVPESMSPQEFDQVRLASEQSDFPRRWIIKAKRIYVGPMPKAPYLTDVLIYGVARETLFNDDNQTPRIADDWHEVITVEAARIGALSLGYWERMKVYEAEVGRLVGTAVKVPVQEDLYDDESTFGHDDGWSGEQG